MTLHFRAFNAPAVHPPICGLKARGDLLRVALAVFTVGCLASANAAPLTQATVTRLENVVNYGEVKAGRSVTRPAAVRDVVRASNFLLTETQARAELEYEDGSVVRVGQNTVFSFEASSRTLSLEKGTLIFFIPKGAGGGRVKTPSLTAAITGTVGKVSENMIAILEGEVTLIPSGRKVPAGSFARRNPDGSITIAPFDMSRAWEGRLMNFNGPMPGLGRDLIPPRLSIDLRPLDRIETLQRTSGDPNSIERFDSDRSRAPDPQPKPEERVVAPKPPPPPPDPPPPRD